MKPKYFLLKTIELGKTTHKCGTHSIWRFTKYLRTINWQESKKFNGSVYLRVSYGKQEDCFGKLVNFYNDGLYENEDDLWLAFKAFTEKNE